MIRRAQIIAALGTLVYAVLSAAQVINMAPLTAPVTQWNLGLLILVAVLACAVYFGRRWAMHTLRVYYALLLAWIGLWALVVSSTRPPEDVATFTTMKRNAQIQAIWDIAALFLLAVASKKEKSPSQ